MDKYALMKRFHYDHQLQVYMYDFMYVGLETTQEEYYFRSKFCSVKNYKKISTPGLVPNNWIGFSYIHS